MNILILAGFGLVFRDKPHSRKLYIDTLEIKFKEEGIPA
jgi:hypothetical protein